MGAGVVYAWSDRKVHFSFLFVLVSSSLVCCHVGMQRRRNVLAAAGFGPISRPQAMRPWSRPARAGKKGSVVVSSPWCGQAICKTNRRSLSLRRYESSSGGVAVEQEGRRW